MIVKIKSIFNDSQIEKIEKHYNARFVCESALKYHDTWTNYPIAIFYQEYPHPEGSNWFGLYYNIDGELRITNAISAVEEEFHGIKARNRDIIYSRFRNDYITSPDQSVWIDGGRSYLRCNSIVDVVKLKIINDDIYELKSE